MRLYDDLYAFPWQSFSSLSAMVTIYEEEYRYFRDSRAHRFTRWQERSAQGQHQAIILT
jgi:hypothetical protein